MRKNVKKVIAAMGAATMVMATAMTSFAAGWTQDVVGWRYDNGNGAFHRSGWQWVDGNNDGTAECYYFDDNAYMLMNTTTPDGYTVNADGAWVDGGVVQTKATGGQAGNTTDTGAGTNTPESLMKQATYDSYGVNVVAKEMLLNARQDDNDPSVGRALNAKFGEVHVDGDISDSNVIYVTYANGFKVEYPVESRSYQTVAVDRNSGLDKSYLFKYYKAGMKADAAAKHLQNNGFAKGISGAYAKGDTCWAETGDMTHINWSDNGIVLR